MRLIPSIIIAIGLSFATAACVSGREDERAVAQVLFVCEHGNVKSLMAASYFNELAQARRLPFRAVSRGSSPDSDTVPDFIKAQLLAEGFEVTNFRPQGVEVSEVAESVLIVTIGTPLPVAADVAAAELEQWNDVPPASTDYRRARESLKTRIADLMDRLERRSRMHSGSLR